MADIIGSLRNEFLRYKALAEGAIAQMPDEDLSRSATRRSNSVAALCWHISGNLKSRFTDFLTTDGEKPWRRRDEEFEARSVTRQELLDRWAEGWDVLMATLGTLSDAQLGDTVRLRQQDLPVTEALHRALAHVSYHTGQIVFIAKETRNDSWVSLSIPPGGSASYNAAPDRERPNQHAVAIAAAPSKGTSMPASHKPQGYTSVSPYLIVDGASRTIAFLQRAFDAVELRRFPSPAGTLMHAEVRIDDTVVMLADGAEGWPPMATHVHVYVPDVDATYRRALDAGATSIQEPVKKDDADKRGGVKDAGGTTWWIATKVE